LFIHFKALNPYPLTAQSVSLEADCCKFLTFPIKCSWKIQFPGLSYTPQDLMGTSDCGLFVFVFFCPAYLWAGFIPDFPLLSRALSLIPAPNDDLFLLNPSLPLVFHVRVPPPIPAFPLSLLCRSEGPN